MAKYMAKVASIVSETQNYFCIDGRRPRWREIQFAPAFRLNFVSPCGAKNGFAGHPPPQSGGLVIFLLIEGRSF